MNIQKIKALNIEPVVQSYDVRDTILYALGLGYGGDPVDESELPFVFEESLKTVPSICCVLCNPEPWFKEPEYDVDWMRVLHAEQAFEIHKPFPPAGTVRGICSVRGIEDKGPGRGALLHQEKALYSDDDDELLATVRSSVFLRGNGGEGGFGEALALAPAVPLPEKAPDKVIDLPVDDRAALIYRLSGDWNPLHVSPGVARQAGFEKPILHGLCTNGMACRALLGLYCENDPRRLKSMFVRFSEPLYPGETVRFEFHEEPIGIRFRAVARERQAVVLDRCLAEIAI